MVLRCYYTQGAYNSEYKRPNSLRSSHLPGCASTWVYRSEMILVIVGAAQVYCESTGRLSDVDWLTEYD